MTVTVVSRTPDGRGRFSVFVEGWLQDWTIDQIKAAVSGGAHLNEWGDR